MEIEYRQGLDCTLYWTQQKPSQRFFFLKWIHKVKCCILLLKQIDTSNRGSMKQLLMIGWLMRANTTPNKHTSQMIVIYPTSVILRISCMSMLLKHHKE